MRDRKDPTDQDGALTGTASEEPTGTQPLEATGLIPPGTVIESYPIDTLTGERLDLEAAGLTFVDGVKNVVPRPQVGAGAGAEDADGAVAEDVAARPPAGEGAED